MRKITFESSEAFWQNRPFSRAGTVVSLDASGTHLHVNGLYLAYRAGGTSKRLHMTLAGLPDRIHLERLNGLLQVGGLRYREFKNIKGRAVWRVFMPMKGGLLKTINPSAWYTMDGYQLSQ